MKRLKLFIGGWIIVGLFACTESTTTTTDEKNKKEEQVPAPVENSGPETEAERATESVKDSAKTTVTIGDGGAGVKTKKGTEVVIDRKKAKLETKKIKVDIKRDTN